MTIFLLIGCSANYFVTEIKSTYPNGTIKLEIIYEMKDSISYPFKVTRYDSDINPDTLCAAILSEKESSIDPTGCGYKNSVARQWFIGQKHGKHQINFLNIYRMALIPMMIW